jgi:UDP-N-acetylenolpyruvoylglucosamine reductase
VSAPTGVERDYPLSRLTTVRAGGSADYFARPSSDEQVVELLAWAERQQLPVGIVGSGSNLLVSDEGFRGLVMKLGEDLTAIGREGTTVVCGGGARLPSAAARAAGWGLAGLEFGVNIPGTVGGAVRMNANAYGGELGKVLHTVTVCTSNGPESRRPDQLGLRYRGSDLGGREVVTGATFALYESNPADVKATMAEMRRRRKEAQPSGIKTFGSTFVNPDDPRAEGRSAGQLLDDAGCRGLAVGGARLSPKHANFVENTGQATTADILGVMAAARRKVFERFGVVLEPEVQILGDVVWPGGWQLES